jgi:GTP cyclohydrolase IA
MKINRYANEGLGRYLSKREEVALISELEKCFSSMRDILGISPKDHNMEDTPKRIAKMMVQETFKGLFEPPPKITFFDNVSKSSQVIFVGNMRVNSFCAHHFLPFTGVAQIGIFLEEGEKLIGLSKFQRVVDHFSSRPQIQEELTFQIAKFIEDTVKPSGVAVRLSAKHLCCGIRGVNSNLYTTTTSLRGVFLTDSSFKDEFLKECHSNFRCD